MIKVRDLIEVMDDETGIVLKKEEYQVELDNRMDIPEKYHDCKVEKIKPSQIHMDHFEMDVK